jgi:GH15 family glucan-1,4-alpha-glucosidase
VAGYLQKLWRLPCSDCWEENETEIHTYTMAAIYAGLMAHSRMRGSTQSSQTALKIKKYVLDRLSLNGYLRKNRHDPEIDSSLLGAAVPYGLIELDSPIFQETLARIEKDLLSPDGGMHRYKKDTYYGGGEWLLLTAWYGWVELKLGDEASARRALTWIESQADEHGNLPEQVSHHLNDMKAYPGWVEQWGQSASPLLWSHAMYIILRTLIG